jgi:hypothetical protein
MAQPDIIPENPDDMHFDIPKAACAFLGTLADGNRLTASQVRLARHDTVVHQIAAEIIIDIKPDISHSQKKGKQGTGTNAASRADAAAQAAGAATALMSLAPVQDEILTALQALPGRGFGMAGTKMPVTVEKPHIYSVIDKCQQCHGAGNGNCLRCNATGNMPCIPCNGNGFSPCQSCGGSGTAQRGDGSRVPCNRCGASGKAPCQICQSHKTVTCTDCSGQGRQDCQSCDRSGYLTDIFQAGWQAEASFFIDRTLIDPSFIPILDKWGEKSMAIDGHAEIFVSAPILKNNKLAYPLMAYAPLSKAEISVEGKTHAALIAGLKAQVFEIDPFLDPVIKPAIQALSKLSKGAMASTALLDQACRFRIVREVLAGLMHHSRRHVYNATCKKYPVGLSDKYTRALVSHAGNAITALGDKPRWKGFVLGCVVTAGLFAVYFLAGARVGIDMQLQARGMGQHMMAADIFSFAVGLGITLLSISMVALGGLHQVMPSSVSTVREKGLPPPGRQGYWAVLACAVIWLGLGFISPHAPAWMPKIKTSQVTAPLAPSTAN